MSSRKSHRPLNSKIEVPWDPSEDLILNSASTGPLETIQITDIHLPANQPRRYFDPQAHQQLVESIREHGILQPLLVRLHSAGGDELVAGERRYRAAIALGLAEVPVVKKDLNDAEAFQLALIENLQREDLNPVEETEGILHLLAIRLAQPLAAIPPLLHRIQHQQKESSQYKASNNVIGNSEAELDTLQTANSKHSNSEQVIVEEVFKSLGKMTWESFVNNRLPLLNLSEDVLEAVRTGKIAYTKARAIAQVKEEKIRKAVLERAIAENWSLEAIKTHLRTLKSKPVQAPLRQQLESTYQRVKKAKLWEDPGRQERLRRLLSELEALLEDG